MQPSFPVTLLAVLLLLSTCSVAQQQIILYNPKAGSPGPGDEKITSRWAPLKFEALKAPLLKIPKRKNDSPFFCDELIQYKDGYIINSITTSPGAGTIDTRCDFFYIDIKQDKFYKLAITGVDTIESVIVSGEKLFVSGKKGGASVILQIENGQTLIINVAIAGANRIIGDNSWIKLCMYEGALYAMDKNGLYRYSGETWQHTAVFSIDSFYTSQLHFRKCKTVIPTENIKMYNNKLYFLQEVLQERDCYLLEYDLDKKDGLVNFWDRYDIKDNYNKEINSYTILDDGSVLIGASRLWETYLLMKEKGDSLAVLVFNNGINDGENRDAQIKARKAIMVDSIMYIAGDNGMFKIENNICSPVALFTNGTQVIKDKDGDEHFDFYPRCFERVSADNYLIGGQFGGLYLVNIKDKKIIPLDDVDYDKITTLNISGIK